MKKSLALLSSFIILLTACSEDIITSDNAADNAIPVKTEAVEKSTFKESIELVGRTTPSEQIPVISSTPSQVKKVHVKEGDNVKKGDLLFSLEDQQLRQQLAQARSAVSTLERSRNQLNSAIEQQQATQSRVNKVIDDTIDQLEEIPLPEQADSDEITATISETLEQLKGVASSGSSLTASTLPLINGQLEQAKGGVRQAESALEATKITSPIDGTVGQVNAKAGAPALPSSPLAVVSSNQDLKAVFSANKFQVKELTEDMPVQMSFEDVSKPIKSTIESISSEPNPETSTYTVSVTLPENQENIQSDSTATALIDTQIKENTLTVPNQAILYDQNKPYVFVVQDERAIKRVIELEGTSKHTSHVSKGLTEGDVVVTEGKYQLINRSKISIKK
ncbi:efflux RND transporter periplasmic adaptor subunit [Alkalihalobacillus sp. TS-13]|uniref:efflux RND transporter periplasmic adaptor subunit n=1 Tax=Alkalihalobacillus sp. TS-13 TaxID=2842455 RepID=UPI001C88656A|nr:efflux RND transporter periplasmic adaptor subunit [Alkalihalobacillus sp. TS-13]